VPVDLIITAVKGAPLVICLDGNSPRGEGRNPPFFSGFGVIPKDIPVSHVAVSDTTLSLSNDITLSWYAGADGIPLQDILPQIFRHIIDELEPSSVWFFGGSGGGFASLYYANSIPESTALVWNPQTDIIEYNSSHVLKYAEVAFGINNGDKDAFFQLSQRINTRIPLSEGNQKCRIIYLQNRTDWHVGRHLEPFLKRMSLPVQTWPFSGFVGKNFYLYIGDWGVGHAAPPKPALKIMLNELLTGKQDPFCGNGESIYKAIRSAFEDHQPLSRELQSSTEVT